MTYRNRKLLNLAKEAPICFMCQNSNDGTVMAAHSNSGEHGKGMGIKASDAMIAMLCFECHRRIDEGAGHREAKRDMWNQAYQKTMRWLIESEHLGVL